MRRRREEDQRLVGEIGGDLSVLTIDGHKLKPRKWEPKEPVQVISHIERKRREEEQEVLAAGGTLIADDFFAKPKPSWNEREKAQWQAANLDSGFVSAKELKKKEEQDLISVCSWLDPCLGIAYIPGLDYPCLCWIVDRSKSDELNPADADA
jgi:hypothetical protein